MYIQLTSAGVALLALGPLQLTNYKLGSSYNYVPDLDQTDVRGSTVYIGEPSQALPVNANVTRHSILIDRSVGDFEFGELGLFVDSTLVAIGVSSTLVDKSKTESGIDGNFIRMDAFVSMVGTTYAMWLNLGNTDNNWVVGSVDSVDYLPAAHTSSSNAMIVESANDNQLAFFAYSDRSGIWAFDQYKYSSTATTDYTVAGSSAFYVELSNTTLIDKLTPVDLGELILQFTTGSCYSICRNIESAIIDGSSGLLVLTFATPLAVLPTVGDKFLVYNRDPMNSRFIPIDIATTDSLGVVQIDSGLSIDVDGLLSVDKTTVDGGLVYSIEDKDGNQLQGDVQLEASMFAGLVETVNTQEPDVAGNVELTASDVGAIPQSEKNEHGGVATLSGTPTDPDDPLINYLLGRIPEHQLSMEALTYKGQWDANANSVTFTDGEGKVNVWALKNSALINATVDGVTTELPGLGSVFRVSTDGFTPIDGNDSWYVDDLVLGLSDKWLRITAAKPIQQIQIGVSITSTLPAGETVLFQVMSSRSSIKTNTKNKAACIEPAQAFVVFDILVDGSDVGEITFESGSLIGNVEFYIETEIYPGSILQVSSPSSLFNMVGLTFDLVFTLKADI